MTNQEQGFGDAGDAGMLRKVDEVTAALEDLADVLGHEDDLPVILRRVCQQAIHAVPDADMASPVPSRGQDRHCLNHSNLEPLSDHGWTTSYQPVSREHR